MKKTTIKFMSIIVALGIAVLFENCGVEELQCNTLWTDAKPISNHFQNNIQTNSGITPELEFSFNPLLLPVKIVYNVQSGFSVESREGTSILTPLGFVNIDYGIGAIRNMNVNGHKISGGDFVVGLVNKRKKTKELFLIKGYSKLKVEIEGKTTILAQTGYVEIDVTEANINEITFTDISKMSIVNTTDYEVLYTLFIKEIESGKSEVACVCKLPPKSYVESNAYLGDIKEFGEKHNLAGVATRNIGIVTKKTGVLFDKAITIGNTQAVDFGESCYIYYDPKSSNFYLSKNDLKKSTPKQSLPIPPTPTFIPEHRVENVTNATPTEYYGYISTVDKNSGVNLRNSASTANKPKYFIPNGSSIKIINKNIKQDTIDKEPGYWHFIEYQGMRGYAWGKFIVIAK